MSTLRKTRASDPIRTRLADQAPTCVTKRYSPAEMLIDFFDDVADRSLLDSLMGGGGFGERECRTDALMYPGVLASRIRRF